MNTGWIIAVVVAVLVAKAWLLHRFIKKKIAASTPSFEEKNPAVTQKSSNHTRKQNDHASR